MISYAQNHEDVVLARIFDEPSGFYIDVGAASPELHSVTKHFYDRGWHGINVEPLERWHRELVAARPRDVNLQIGLSDEPGILEFYDVGSVAAEESTFSPDVAETLRANGIEPDVRTVEVTKLAAVCERYAPERIDFLKLDVEGWELQVLRGGDWDRFRPVAVTVERTPPRTSQPASRCVNDFMRSAGYTPGLFDGLNRFYVRADHEHLLPLLSVPANVTDGFVDAEVAALRESLDAAKRRLASLGESLDAAERRLASIAGRVATGDAQLRVTQLELASARREANDAQIQFRATREALECLVATAP